MNGFGLLSIFAGALQLTIPSYALRLVRRFGANRVGSFVVLAFACLALLHLMEPFGQPLGRTSSHSLDVVYAIGSLLLLIGMAHVETLVSERINASSQKDLLNRRCEETVDRKTEALAQTNRELTLEIARLEKIEKTLAESERQYKFLFMENPLPMWICDLRSLQFLAVNNAAMRQQGMAQEDFRATGIQSLVAPEATARFMTDFARPCHGVEARETWPFRRKDGTTIEAELTAVDLKYCDRPARLMLINDVGARRRNERILLEGKKVETVARIAGGVAHHFNNLLTIISGRTNLLMETSRDDESISHLQHIGAATQRGAGLTRQLLAAGAQSGISPQPINLNHLVEQKTTVLRRLVGASITVRLGLTSNLPLVLADAHSVENILVNLALNARDAMPSGGVLTLSTLAVRAVGSEAQLHPHGKAGEFVCLTLRDTGTGISEEVQARLFEPFFTTKEFGKALGLGLASVQGQVRQQSGWIECQSQPKSGTEFRVFLQCAPREMNAHLVAARKTPSNNRERILLVEPNEQLRALARFVLNREGFKVVEADAASVAMTLWEAEGGKLDLLVTASQLPEGFSGLELANQLRSLKPSLKVVFAKGDEVESGQQSIIIPEAEHQIPRPYTAEKLLPIVEKCLAKAIEA